MNMLNIFRGDLAARIREERLSQSELARLFEVEQGSLSRFLRGESGLSGKSVFALWPFVYGDLPQRRPSSTVAPTLAPPGENDNNRPEL